MSLLVSPFRAAVGRDVVLQQGRVLLRPPQSKDWRAWADLRLESRDFLKPWEPVWPYDALTRASFRRRLRQYSIEARHGSGHAYFIFDRRGEGGEGDLLGGISVSNLRRGVAQSASLGYWIGERHARHGYMTEALQALVTYCFDGLGLHRLEAACLPHNTPSRALLEKAGFSQEGYARQYLRIDGRWQDHVLYAMLAGDRGPGAKQPRSITASTG